MPELKNVRMASVGVFTIASPRRLNDVFMRTGTPVRLPNSLIRFQYSGLISFSTVCGRALPSTCVTDGMTSRFSGRTGFVRIMNGESQACSRYSPRHFLQHGRRKRAPPFAEFDRVVHFGVHFRIARIGQDRAVSQRARAELHSSLEPTDDFSIGEKFGGGCGDVIQLRRAELVGPQRLFNFRVGKFGAEIGVAKRLHGQPAAAVQVRRKHGAERHAVIRSRGLNKNIVDHARRLNLSVRFGVERHASGETHVAAAGFLRRQLHQRQHGGLAGVLHGKGNVLETVVDFAFGRPLGAKPLGDGGSAVVAFKQKRRVDAIRLVI